MYTPSMCWDPYFPKGKEAGCSPFLLGLARSRFRRSASPVFTEVSELWSNAGKNLDIQKYYLRWTVKGFIVLFWFSIAHKKRFSAPFSVIMFSTGFHSSGFAPEVFTGKRVLFWKVILKKELWASLFHASMIHRCICMVINGWVFPVLKPQPMIW